MLLSSLLLLLLDFRTIVVDVVPTRQTLVQWLGLSLDNTSWENWDELCVIHNLKNKFASDGASIDMDQTSS